MPIKASLSSKIFLPIIFQQFTYLGGTSWSSSLSKIELIQPTAFALIGTIAGDSI